MCSYFSDFGLYQICNKLCMLCPLSKSPILSRVLEAQDARKLQMGQCISLWQRTDDTEKTVSKLVDIISSFAECLLYSETGNRWKIIVIIMWIAELRRFKAAAVKGDPPGKQNKMKQKLPYNSRHLTSWIIKTGESAVAVTCNAAADPKDDQRCINISSFPFSRSFKLYWPIQHCKQFVWRRSPRIHCWRS